MLNIHIENTDDLAIVECEGRIVRSESAFRLRDAVTSQANARTIVLDLSAVTAIAGGGLGMLMFLQRWAHDHDIRLKLFNPTRPVRDKLELATSVPDFEIVAPDQGPAFLAGA
jgi:anti-anti-sigma regulatory factor